MSCISPRAPSRLSARGSKLDSQRMTAETSAGIEALLGGIQRDEIAVIERMLRALGGLGFEPAALLLLGEIGLRDGNRARDEQNHRQRQREKANRRAADRQTASARGDERPTRRGESSVSIGTARTARRGTAGRLPAKRRRRDGASAAAGGAGPARRKRRQIQAARPPVGCVCSIVPSVSMTAFARRIFSSGGICESMRRSACSRLSPSRSKRR